MGYPIFGKIKTIVLPLDSEDNFSLADYKDKYGIDLKSMVKLDPNGYLYLEFPNMTDVRLAITGVEGDHPFSPISQINAFFSQKYVSGSANCLARYGTVSIDGDIGYGIELYVDKDEDFTLDNVRIEFYSL